MKNQIIIFLGILFIVLMNGVSAQSGVNQTQQSNVTVTVSAVTMVDINPASLSYTANPGSACGRYLSNGLCNESGNNYYAIQVENIGSWNVTKIWFNVSQEDASPFGTGSDLNVNPGNFLLMTTDDTTNDFYFVDRREFPEIKTVVYLRDPDGNMPANLSKFHYGRLHNGSLEYFYMLDTSPGCNVSAITDIRIGMNPQSATLLGSTDFSTGASVNYDQINLTTVAGYAIANINVGPLAGYAVAVENKTCSVRFGKWNKDYPFDTLGNAQYSFNGVLTPGDSLAKRIGVLVPLGTYATTKTGFLTAIAIGAT